MLQPKKPIKKTKKSTNPADSYPPMKDKRGVPTIGGGEGTTPPFTKAEMEYKKKMTGLPKGKMGKTISKAKNGKSFPDLNKDGKVTRADILKGRGVIAKKGATIKKAKSGTKVKKAFLGSALGGVGKSLLGGGGLGNIGDMFGGGLGKGLNKIMGSLGKKGIGKGKNPLADPMISKSMKSGGSMKKCRYGCK